jgi:hypothetical protein
MIGRLKVIRINKDKTNVRLFPNHFIGNKEILYPKVTSEIGNSFMTQTPQMTGNALTIFILYNFSFLGLGF